MRGKLWRSFRHDGATRHVLEAQLDVAKPNDVAALQLGVLDADAIDQNAVGAALIPDNPNVALAFEQRVTPRNTRMGKRDVVGRGSSDVNRGAIFQLVKTRRSIGSFND